MSENKNNVQHRRYIALVNDDGDDDDDDDDNDDIKKNY